MESKIFTVISLLVLGTIIGAGGFFLFAADTSDDVAGQAYDSLLGELETDNVPFGDMNSYTFPIFATDANYEQIPIGHVEISARNIEHASTLLASADVSLHGLIVDFNEYDSVAKTVPEDSLGLDVSPAVDSSLAHIDYEFFATVDADGLDDADDELEGDNETLNKTKKICDTILTAVNSCAVKTTNSYFVKDNTALSVATQKNVQSDFVSLTDNVVSYAQGTSESSKDVLSDMFTALQRSCYVSVKEKLVEKYNGTERMDLLDKCFNDLEENDVTFSTVLTEQDEVSNENTDSNGEDDTGDSNDSSSQGGSMTSSFTGDGCEEVEHDGKTCYWVTPKKAADEFDLLDGTDCENLQNSVVGTLVGGSISFGTGVSFVVEDIDENNRRLVCQE